MSHTHHSGRPASPTNSSCRTPDSEVGRRGRPPLIRRFLFNHLGATTARSEASEADECKCTWGWDEERAGTLRLTRSARYAVLDGREGAEVDVAASSGNNKVRAPDAAGGSSAAGEILAVNKTQEALGDIVNRGWIAGVPTSKVWNSGGGR